MKITPEIAREMKQQAVRNQDMLRRSYDDLNKIAQKGQILFTGSSLMEQFPVNEIAMSMGITKTIYNRGIGGTTTDDFLAHIGTVLLDLEPSKVFINIGTNDIHQREDGEPWQAHLLKNYRRILEILKEKLPQTGVYMMAYYPINADLPDTPEWTKAALRTRSNEALNDTNGKLAALAQEMGCRFIDCNDGIKDAQGRQKAEYSKEGMHMYPAAYIQVFKALRQYL